MADLLPSNATALERAAARVLGFEHISTQTLHDIWNPWRCPEHLLPWLAWSLSVDFWADDWPTERKRAVIAGSIAWHRKKGTPWAVEQALEAIGYPNSTLIEHRELYQEWLEAGGGLLNGDGTLNGDGDLSAPLGTFRFTTRSWAEYAVRLNIGEADWSRARQREAVAVCNAYAPARSELIALIVTALLAFDAHIRLTSAKVRGRVRLTECQRFQVAAFETLDGCSPIGGTNEPDTLNGAGTLDGQGDLSGYLPAGEPLNAGQFGIRIKARLCLDLFFFGGDSTEPAEYLHDDPHLDGRYTIAGETLDGYDPLDGKATLAYPTLSSPDATLDGTTNLGARRGPQHIHHTAMLRIKRGSQVIQEPI